jgi:hypothetical protein
MGHESGMLIALPAFALPITRQRWDGFKSLHLTMAHPPSAASWCPRTWNGVMVLVSSRRRLTTLR